MNVILFAPEDLSLVKGSPQIRRKFLDMELGQINPIYLYDLVQYQAILKQRNQYLKQLNEKNKLICFIWIFCRTTSSVWQQSIESKSTVRQAIGVLG